MEAQVFNGTNDTSNLYYWLVKTDSRGNLDWNRQYGNGPETVNRNITENQGALDGLNRRTAGDNEATSVTQTTDGGFVIAGVTYLERHSPWYTSKSLLVKTDSEGNMEWNQTFDGYANSIIQTDAGLAFAGSKGVNEGWLVKTDAYGNLQWDKTFQGPYNIVVFNLNSIIESKDGALVVLGLANNGINFWGANFYLIKTEAFLPFPPSLPLPEAEQTVDTSVLGAVVIAVVAVGVGLSVYLKRRKRKA